MGEFQELSLLILVSETVVKIIVIQENDKLFWSHCLITIEKQKKKKWDNEGKIASKSLFNQFDWLRQLPKIKCVLTGLDI